MKNEIIKKAINFLLFIGVVAGWLLIFKGVN